ncbi:hypothetical protein [Legionella shakespearei]|uniref:Uncharacterized protein n=1 Tax=Legionella shakespearei DSM 23087 TaxID=1122169 RepID=A0A0W0YVL9_9GAMM|nr:hypothetical protein [Legionella shakespearei]KTD60751.1 hypothetical protein Lsha_1468 [Legionella shakespearei DSM 23087]
MGIIHNICNEVQTAELAKLQGFIAIYQAGYELVKAMENSPDAAERIDDIHLLKRCLKPYQEIYAIVGDDVHKYLLANGVQFTPEDSDAEIAKKMLIFASSDAFFAIRKSAAVACSQYSKLNDLYLKHVGDFSTTLMSFERFQSKLIKCVQIFSQFALLGRELVKETGGKAHNDTFVLVSTIFKDLADYANILQSGQSHSDKTVTFASTAMIPGFDTKRRKTEAQLDVLKQELKILEEQLKEKQDHAEKLMASQAIIEQSQLLDTWNTLWPASALGAVFPKDTESMAKMVQALESAFAQQNTLIKAKQDEIKRTLDTLKTIASAMEKFDPSTLAALRKVNEIQVDAATHLMRQYNLHPVSIMENPDNIITAKANFLTEYDKPVVEVQTPKSPKTSGSLMDLFRGRSSTGRDMVLTRNSPPTSPRGEASASTSSSSSSSTEDLPVVKSEPAIAPTLRLKFFVGTSRPSRSASAPPKPEAAPSSPRIEVRAAPPAATGTASTPGSPSIKERIDSLNAAGGIKFSPRPR